MKNKIYLFFAILVSLLIGASTASGLEISNVDVKYFGSNSISTVRSSVFWFGSIGEFGNGVDIRAGYNDEAFRLTASVFDRRLHYGTDASDLRFGLHDSVVYEMAPEGRPNSAVRVSVMLRWWENHIDYVKIETLQASRSSAIDLPGYEWVEVEKTGVHASGQWYGDAPNNNGDDRGYQSSVEIPFELVGLSPSEDWLVKIVNHDRDDDFVSVQEWGGRFRFNRERYQSHSSENVLTLVNGQQGVKVEDTHVGGGSNCGIRHDPNFFDGWGDYVWGNVPQINVQNQMNTEDWPCFSRVLLWFELPEGVDPSLITAAKLNMSYFGSAGYVASDAKYSTIQAIKLKEKPKTLSWNGTPQADGHIDAVGVLPVSSYLGQPNYQNFDYLNPPNLIEFDITEAARDPDTDRFVSIALYSADWNLHSGKFFWSSNGPVQYRPVISIEYGEPHTLFVPLVSTP